MNTHETEAANDRLLFPHEVRAEVRLSEPTIYRLRRKGKFPEPILLGERRIAWWKSTIDKWLADRTIDCRPLQAKRKAFIT
jgi:predicted DNA-binding transcriptional regulator AlpA